MREVLQQVKTRPTCEEQWPDQYQAGIIKGKKYTEKIEGLRKSPTSMSEILSRRPDVAEWWNAIPS
jgi:hypothetical protein